MPFDFIPEERRLTQPEELLTYSYDATDHRGRPGLVLRPVSREEVVEIVKEAHETGTPIVPRGAGTSLSGGPVPADGAVVLDLTLMDRVREVREGDRLVTVEPGVVYAELNRHLEEYGLFFPPDPGSGSVCTIGGMVAANSSGIRAVKYGTTRDYVARLEVVLADGRVIETGTYARKSSSGYDLTGFFVGSEGTLGVFTEVTLRLLPKPTHYAAARLAFDGPGDAAEAVGRIIASGLEPAVLEFMDRNTLRTVEEYTGLGLPDAGGVLLIEMDGFDDGVEDSLKQAIELAGAGEVETATPREELWKARKAALPSLARRAPGLVLEDVTVPISRLPEMLQGIEEIAGEYGIAIATFGHAGDGNLHPTFLVEERDRNLEAALERLFSHALALGGTLSGEHGIGLEKKGYMDLEHRGSLELMKAIKRELDPGGILNPGKVF
ncbi:MAG: FAD-binding protein [Euryarchaeota archaeon]|nr:FAD-binding protein [Euryarchaeota archaeon]